MRARPAALRRRTTVRSRLIVPVAAAAALALVGGVVVATEESPISRDQVQTVALSAPTATAGIALSFNVKDLAAQAGFAGAVITGIDGLPEGLSYDAATGVVSGTATTSGVYQLKVHATVAGQSVTVPVSVTVNNADGTAPVGAGEGTAGLGSEAALQGSLGGNAQANGEVGTGSSGIDGLVGAVSGLFESLTSGTGSAAGSNGGGGATATATATAPAPTGVIQAGSTGGLPGSSGDAQTGGTIEVPGSSANSGSLGSFAPALAISGAALLGLAGLSLLLNGGSSTPGSVATIPGLGGSLGGSLGGAPAPTTVVTAPGPTVANGRG